jgi:hypothetical protein
MSAREPYIMYLGRYKKTKLINWKINLNKLGLNIHNRIAAFCQQHVNQRQKSIKIKAVFSECIQYNVFPPNTFIYHSPLFKMYCQAGIQASSLKTKQTKTDVIEIYFCFRVFHIPNSNIFFLPSHPQCRKLPRQS